MVGHDSERFAGAPAYTEGETEGSFMVEKGLFEKAFAYAANILALPVTDLDTAVNWYAQHFGLVEVDRRSEPQPTVIMERDGTRIGFSVNGGDSSQEGAAILVSDIHAARAELESRGVEIGD